MNERRIREGSLLIVEARDETWSRMHSVW